MNIVETPSSWCVCTLISSSKDWIVCDCIQTPFKLQHRLCAHRFNVLNLIKCSHLECILCVWGLEDNDGKQCLQSALVETHCSYFLSDQRSEGSRFNEIKEKCLLIFVPFVKLPRHFGRKTFFHIFVLIAGPKKVIQKVLLNQVILIFNTIWVQRKSFTQLQKVHLISIFTQGLWIVALFTVTHYLDLKQNFTHSIICFVLLKEIFKYQFLWARFHNPLDFFLTEEAPQPVNVNFWLDLNWFLMSVTFIKSINQPLSIFILQEKTNLSTSSWTQNTT